MTRGVYEKYTCLDIKARTFRGVTGAAGALRKITPLAPITIQSSGDQIHQFTPVAVTPAMGGSSKQPRHLTRE